MTERGRQQISFNGGLSGIGGSFFGLEYSTNNLLGRGEMLSLNLAAGNRQKYLPVFVHRALHQEPSDHGRLLGVWLHAKVLR